MELYWKPPSFESWSNLLWCRGWQELSSRDERESFLRKGILYCCFLRKSAEVRRVEVVELLRRFPSVYSWKSRGGGGLFPLEHCTLLVLPEGDDSATMRRGNVMDNTIIIPWSWHQIGTCHPSYYHRCPGIVKMSLQYRNCFCSTRSRFYSTASPAASLLLTLTKLTRTNPLGYEDWRAILSDATWLASLEGKNLLGWGWQKSVAADSRHVFSRRILTSSRTLVSSLICCSFYRMGIHKLGIVFG